MKVFTYSEARQRLSAVLDMARREEVLIARRGGETFCLTYRTGIKTKATTQDILEAGRESRSRGAQSDDIAAG